MTIQASEGWSTQASTLSAIVQHGEAQSVEDNMVSLSTQHIRNGIKSNHTYSLDFDPDIRGMLFHLDLATLIILIDSFKDSVPNFSVLKNRANKTIFLQISHMQYLD